MNKKFTGLYASIAAMIDTAPITDPLPLCFVSMSDTGNYLYKKPLANIFNEHAIRDYFLTVFAVGGLVYAIKTKSPLYTSCSKASKSGGYALRFRPDIPQKKALATFATPICTTEMYATWVRYCEEDGMRNKGFMIERLCTESQGQIWEHDNIKFWQGCDLIASNGDKISIKSEGATLCNMRNCLSCLYSLESLTDGGVLKAMKNFCKKYAFAKESDILDALETFDRFLGICTDYGYTLGWNYSENDETTFEVTVTNDETEEILDTFYLSFTD